MPNGPKVINPWPLALALLTVAVALANYVWLRMNQLPPVDDEAYHLWSALKYFRHLERPSFAGLGPLLNLGDLYPPLFPLLAALGARVLGAADTLTLCMANVPFVAVTFFSLYGIGLRMGDRRVGVLASCFLVLYPMFFHMGRMFMLDIALTGMVTLTLLILLCSEGFSRRGWSLLAGIALGLGLLTKQTFPVFVAGPAVYILFRSWKGLDASQRKARILHFGLFVVLGMAIAFPWYFAQAEKKFLGMKSAFLTRDRTYFDLAGSVFGTLVFYGETLVRNQMGRVFFGGFIVAVALSFKKCLRAPFVPIWFAVPFLILILFPNKWYYYTLPCLPAAAFLTAGGLLSLKRTIVRRAAVSVLILLGVEQFVVLSFMSPQLSTQLLSFSRYAPQREDYHAEALFRRLEDQRETESPVIAVPDVDPNTYSGSEGVTLGDNYVLVNWNTLRYIVALRSKPWTIKRICDLDDQDLLKKPDFIVCHGDLEKMGVPGPLSASYRLTDIFVMPDESRVHLYKLGSPGAAGREEVVVHRAGNRFMLDNGLLQLDRGNNRWRLFWKGKMVVQKLVVIAADDPFRIWNDSERCRWKILSRSKDRLVARASSSFFHPDQEWEFVLDGHRLYWTVKVYERFYRRSDWEEVRVHLSEKYCRWRTDVGSGDFPQRAVESRKETWWPLAKGGPFDTAFVGVERVEEELPSVTFFSLRSREGLKGEVGGTEGCFSSKVLQYVLREPWRLGRFRGCLVLEDGVQAA